MDSLTLLSQSSLLLPRGSKSYYVQETVHDVTFGLLDVYVFDPQVTVSTPSHLIASFELPKLAMTSCQSELEIEIDQRPKFPSNGADQRPKVYDLHDRLITVAVWLKSFPTSSFA